MTAPSPNAGQTPTHEAAVAANVRLLREAAGLSQADVAKRATDTGYDLGEMAVWSLEKGRRRIRVEDLFAFAAVLGTTVQNLLAPEADPNARGLPYEISFEDGTSERVTADSHELGERWVRFSLMGELVYLAATSRIVGIRVKQEAQ